MSGIQPGTIVDGRFQLGDEIGRGGMGIVYRAYQLSIEREVAVKVLRPDCSTDLNKLQRFRREAHLISVLEHPHIVQVYAIGMIQAGQPYIAMEFLPGEQLSERISRTGPLDWREAVPIFTQICDALQYAHDKQIIHRDLKPSNIALLRDDGKTIAKLVDFGIAKILEERSAKLTRTDMVVGSVLYTSPAQFEGKDADVSSDIYSLGCSFYEALTGVPPFNGDTVFETIVAHLNEEPKAIHEVNPGANIPADLQYLISAMLRKDDKFRPRSAAEVKARLDDILRGVPIERDTYAAAAKPRARKWYGNRMAWTACATVGLLIAAGAFASTMAVPQHAPQVTLSTPISTDPEEPKLVDRVLSIPNKHSYGYAENVYELGNLYCRNGKVLEAQMLHERVVGLHVPGQKGECKNHNSLGRAYMYTGRWKDAERSLLHSVECAGSVKDSTFTQKDILISLYITMGEFEKAKAIADTLLAGIDAGFRSEDEAQRILQKALIAEIALGHDADAANKLERLKQFGGNLPDTKLAEGSRLIKRDPVAASVLLTRLVRELDANTATLMPDERFAYYSLLKRLMDECQTKLESANAGTANAGTANAGTANERGLSEFRASVQVINDRARNLFNQLNDRSLCRLPV